jgi:phosphoribosyl 1,2-cyclic phosphodiesterase
MLQVKFWGVRGSCASAGHGTAEVGGNTSCVEVRAGDTRVVLDAGTGLRALGASLLSAGGPVEIHLLLSHFHWDHIQGFPFFTPAYLPGNRIEIYGPERAAGRDVRAALDAQMRAPHFPVGLEAMRAELGFYPVPAGAQLRLGLGTTIEVTAAAANHPGGCLAYRLESGGRSVVYATDTEHGEDLDCGLLELARGCDLLIYDAQYTAAEYPSKRGWGHSTPEEAVKLARAAGAGQLVLFHHDPGHDDEAISRMEKAARALFPLTTAAREGLEILLAPHKGRKAA